MKKRIISLLLVVAMIISVIPVIANAEAVETAPSFKSVSLTLDGILRLNVKVNPGSVSDMAGYKVKFTVGEETPWECTEPTQQDNLYVYTAKIPAHKLHKTVKVELLDAENEVIDESSWTLDAYNAAVIAWDSGMTGLANSLDLYAKNAAAYATNSESIVPETAVNQETLVGYQIEKETPEATVTPIAKLLLNDACTLRVQVKVADWVEGYSLKICGEAKELEYDETNSVYYYDIKDIRAQDWGTKYAVEIVDGESETLYKCKYAVMSYVYSVLGVPESYAKELNLLKSMYLYFNEADNYKNAERYDYSLTYNANYEGSEETKVDTANITGTNKNFAVAANSFVRPGYKFVGWNTKADGTGTSYAVGDTVGLNAAQALLDEKFNAISNEWTAYDAPTNGTGDVGIMANWDAGDGDLKHINNNGISYLMFDTVVDTDNYEIISNMVLPKGTNYSIGLVFADNQFIRLWNNASNFIYLYAGFDVNNSNANYDGCKQIQAQKDSGITAGENVTLKIKVEGNKVAFYANDLTEPWAEATTTKENLHGKIGVYVRSSVADDFACVKDVKVVSAPNMTETLYAQWEVDPVLFGADFNDNVVDSAYIQYANAVSATESAWYAENGVVKCTPEASATNTAILLFDTEINSDNYEYTAEVLMPEEGHIGLVFAANDEMTDFYHFRVWLNGRLYTTAGHDVDGLSGLSNDVANGKANYQFAPSVGQTFTLKVVVNGQNFAIYADRYKLCEGTTTKDNLHGKVGLLLRGKAPETVSFDNIMVVDTAVTAG